MLKPLITVPATYARIRNVPALMITGPIARPSSPSVRLTAFEVPTTTTHGERAGRAGSQQRERVLVEVDQRQRHAQPQIGVVERRE